MPPAGVDAQSEPESDVQAAVGFAKQHNLNEGPGVRDMTSLVEAVARACRRCRASIIILVLES